MDPASAISSMAVCKRAAFVPPSSATPPPAIFWPAFSSVCISRCAFSWITYARLNRSRWFQGATCRARRSVFCDSGNPDVPLSYWLRAWYSITEGSRLWKNFACACA